MNNIHSRKQQADAAFRKLYGIHDRGFSYSIGRDGIVKLIKALKTTHQSKYSLSFDSVDLAQLLPLIHLPQNLWTDDFAHIDDERIRCVEDIIEAFSYTSFIIVYNLVKKRGAPPRALIDCLFTPAELNNTIAYLITKFSPLFTITYTASSNTKNTICQHSDVFCYLNLQQQLSLMHRLLSSRTSLDMSCITSELPKPVAWCKANRIDREYCIFGEGKATFRTSDYKTYVEMNADSMDYLVVLTSARLDRIEKMMKNGKITLHVLFGELDKLFHIGLHSWTCPLPTNGKGDSERLVFSSFDLDQGISPTMVEFPGPDRRTIVRVTTERWDSGRDKRQLCFHEQLDFPGLDSPVRLPLREVQFNRTLASTSKQRAFETPDHTPCRNVKKRKFILRHPRPHIPRLGTFVVSQDHQTTLPSPAPSSSPQLSISHPHSPIEQGPPTPVKRATSIPSPPQCIVEKVFTRPPSNDVSYPDYDEKFFEFLPWVYSLEPVYTLNGFDGIHLKPTTPLEIGSQRQDIATQLTSTMSLHHANINHPRFRSFIHVTPEELYD